MANPSDGGSHDRLTHASFFSGAGGLDLGLDRAGWTTVSFSEIEPYANAVLAARWPGVPNLGDITALATQERARAGLDPDRREGGDRRVADAPDAGRSGDPGDWRSATLWTGGFPCQDLSVAGKRRGMGAGTRSGLAYAFLDLVGLHRPRFVLLENVPGLLSSHAGRDFGALLRAMVELGYGVGYRILDARYFGVPQRRRRVFIVADALGGRAGADRAAEVLSIGSRCRRHPPTGIEAGEDVTYGTDAGAVLARESHGVGHNYPDDHLVTGHGVLADGATATRTLGANMGWHGYTYGAQDIDGGWLQTAPALTSRQERLNHPGDQAYVRDTARPLNQQRGHYDPDTDTHVVELSGAVGTRPYDDRGHENGGLVGPAPDADRVRAPDGVAGRAHDSAGMELAGPLLTNAQGGQRTTDLNTPLAYGLRASDGFYSRGDGTDNLLAYRKATKAHDADDSERWEEAAAADTLAAGGGTAGATAILSSVGRDEAALPPGLDAHRYRCCGNGVVAPVAEWIAGRLRAVVEQGA